jgi:tetratricopeptide (TPR) repeat protein
MHLDRYHDALKASRESVKIRRQLAKLNYDKYSSELLSSLNTLGTILGERKRYHLEVIVRQAATDIVRLLANDRPEKFLHELAYNRHNEAISLKRLGRLDDAYAAHKEAEKLSRSLAETGGLDHTLLLGGVLNGLSHTLFALKQYAEAAGAAHAALEAMVTAVECNPRKFRLLAQLTTGDYVQYCAAASLAPDSTLLERVAEAVRPEITN